MQNKRRAFLQNAGLLAAGSILMPQWACQSGAKEAATSTAAPAVTAAVQPSVDKFGIQLYTRRDVIPAEPKGTLKEVAGDGFKQIEGYDGPQGLFWNMPNTEFKNKNTNSENCSFAISPFFLKSTNEKKAPTSIATPDQYVNESKTRLSLKAYSLSP